MPLVTPITPHALRCNLLDAGDLVEASSITFDYAGYGTGSRTINRVDWDDAYRTYTYPADQFFPADSFCAVRWAHEGLDGQQQCMLIGGGEAGVGSYGWRFDLEDFADKNNIRVEDAGFDCHIWARITTSYPYTVNIRGNFGAGDTYGHRVRWENILGFAAGWKRIDVPIYAFNLKKCGRRRAFTQSAISREMTVFDGSANFSCDLPMGTYGLEPGMNVYGPQFGSGFRTINAIADSTSGNFTSSYSGAGGLDTVEFWNTKLTLTSVILTAGSRLLTCDDTSGVTVGMKLHGIYHAAAITSGTTIVMQEKATSNFSGSIVASEGDISIDGGIDGLVDIGGTFDNPSTGESITVTVS